ncbi:zinc-containing alcohol dehydrogenase [Fusarium oxysporum f. sp. phaseoli]
MLERFLYSLPPRGTSLLIASSIVVISKARPIDINTVNLSSESPEFGRILVRIKAIPLNWRDRILAIGTRPML